MSNTARTKIMSTLNDSELLSTLSNLKARWAAEKEHEPFSEYEKVLKTISAGRGLLMKKATKRPFGFVAKIDEKTTASFFIKRKGKYNVLAAKYNK